MKRTAFTGAKIITADKAHELIQENGSKWFWTAFIRKTDKRARNKQGVMVTTSKKGDIRYMCARTGVKSKLRTNKGEGRKYNFTEKRLSSVWDRQVQGYRAFSWDHMVYLKIGGRKYVVMTENARQFCKANPDHEMAIAVKKNRVEV